ncbi:MAG: T9SS type A sorting domain-containing protein [Saprospiraceae bacterium]|nr:T9SS type A sorting domain-containing protein [Saprospiraceae bacterium]
MKYFIALFFLIVHLVSLPAQNPFVVWTKTLGSSQYDYASAITVTNDNKYLVVGNSFSISGNGLPDGDFPLSRGNQDVWLVKLDENGSVLWKKNYGGSGGEFIFCINPTSDNGFIMIGATTSADGDATENKGKGDVWVVKIDSVGTVQWQKTIGGSENELGQSILQLSNGDYILGLYSLSNDKDLPINKGKYDVWVIKLNSQGNIIWKKNIGGSDDDEIAQITAIDNKTVAIAGSSSSTDGDMVGVLGDYSLKMDTAGNILWKRSFGYYNDTISSLRYSYAVTMNQKDLVFAGMRIVPNFSPNATLPYSWDFLITKSDTAGRRKWSKLYGGSDTESPRGIHSLPNGDIVVTGYTLSSDSIIRDNHGDLDFWILRLDSLGNLKDAHCFGGTKKDRAKGSIIDKKGNVIIIGDTDSSDGTFPQNKGLFDWAILKLNYGITNTQETTIETINIVESPNPVLDRLTIQIKSNSQPHLRLYNITGTLVYQQQNLNPTTTIDMSSFPSGFYLLSYQIGHQYACRKIFKL